MSNSVIMTSVASLSANQAGSLVQMLYTAPKKYSANDSSHLLAQVTIGDIIHLNNVNNLQLNGEKLMLGVSISSLSIRVKMIVLS